MILWVIVLGFLLGAALGLVLLTVMGFFD